MNPNHHPDLIRLADYFLGQKDTFHSLNQWHRHIPSPPEIKQCVEQTHQSPVQCVCQHNQDCETGFEWGKKVTQDSPQQTSVQVCHYLYENQNQKHDKPKFIQGCVAGLWN